jgi:hypothetical protein
MLSRDQLRAYARAGAVQELEALARKIAVAFPELDVNVAHLPRAAAPPAAEVAHKDPASTRRYLRPAAPRRRRKWSAAARARAALAMKARWRKVKKAGATSLAGKES